MHRLEAATKANGQGPNKAWLAEETTLMHSQEAHDNLSGGKHYNLLCCWCYWKI